MNNEPDECDGGGGNKNVFLEKSSFPGFDTFLINPVKVKTKR